MKRKLALIFLFAFLVCSINITSASKTVHAAKAQKLNVKKLELTIGNSFCLRVRNMKKKHRVVFTSSKKRVANVDNTTADQRYTMVQACKKGKTTIIATIYRGERMIRKLKCKVQVTPSGASIKFAKKKQTINLAENEKLRLHTIIKPNNSTEQPVFESSNPEVATVSFDGVVTAITPGTTIITATLLSTDQKITCKITVIYDEDMIENTNNNTNKRNWEKANTNEKMDYLLM